MNNWKDLLEKKGMGTNENDCKKLTLELEENREKLKRRENMIRDNRLEIKRLKLEKKKMDEISLIKGEKLLKYFDEREIETNRIQILEHQIKDMRISTRKIISAAIDQSDENKEKIRTLERNIINEKQISEECIMRLNISKLTIQSFGERLEKQSKELETWRSIGIKQNWLFEKMKEIGLQQSDDIFECFQDIEIPQTSTHIREIYIPTEETSTIDIVSSDEEEEYYREDSEIEQIYLSYHAIKIQKIFRGYLVRKEYPFSLDSF